MTDELRNERIELITHGELTRAIISVINELQDQGFSWYEIEKYLDAKHQEALSIIHR